MLGGKCCIHNNKQQTPKVQIYSIIAEECAESLEQIHVPKIFQYNPQEAISTLIVLNLYLSWTPSTNATAKYQGKHPVLEVITPVHHKYSLPQPWYLQVDLLQLSTANQSYKSIRLEAEKKAISRSAQGLGWFWIARWRCRRRKETVHEIHETCHSITFLSYEKTHLLILAGSAFYQIWLGR